MDRERDECGKAAGVELHPQISDVVGDGGEADRERVGDGALRARCSACGRRGLADFLGC